jgi:hypothetical protein
MQPDRPEMFSANLHVSVYIDVVLEAFKYPTLNSAREAKPFTRLSANFHRLSSYS